MIENLYIYVSRVFQEFLDTAMDENGWEIWTSAIYEFTIEEGELVHMEHNDSVYA